MSKAILMSIRPKWVAKILNGEKTIEIRKKFPIDYVGWVYIYNTKTTKEGVLKLAYIGNKLEFVLSYDKTSKYQGKVVARFWCDKVEQVFWHNPRKDEHIPYLKSCNLLKCACLCQDEFEEYVGDNESYAIHITNLEIFDKPKEIKEFKRVKWNKCGVKDKNGLYQCHKCPHAIHYGHGFGDCGYDLPLKAPQSWCYIEV